MVIKFNKFIKLFVFLVFCFSSFLLVSSVSANPLARGTVVGVNEANMTLSVRMFHDDNIYDLDPQELSDSLKGIYFSGVPTFYESFYGAIVVYNDIVGQFFFDTSYNFINVKEQNAYELGFNDGVLDGGTASFNNGYNYGYGIGYDNGLIDGNVIGYNEGYGTGYSNGYGIGYNTGLGANYEYRIDYVNSGLYDTFDLNTYTFVNRVNRYIFNGTETWGNASTMTDTVIFSSNVSTRYVDPVLTYTDTATAVSNYFPQMFSYSSDFESFFYNYDSGNLYIYVRIKKTRLTGYDENWNATQRINAFKSWLGVNNLITQYKTVPSSKILTEEEIHQLVLWRNGYDIGYDNGIADSKPLKEFLPSVLASVGSFFITIINFEVLGFPIAIVFVIAALLWVITLIFRLFK